MEEADSLTDGSVAGEDLGPLPPQGSLSALLWIRLFLGIKSLSSHSSESGQGEATIMRAGASSPEDPPEATQQYLGGLENSP